MLRPRLYTPEAFRVYKVCPCGRSEGNPAVTFLEEVLSMTLKRDRRGLPASAGAALISVRELHPFLARHEKRATPQVSGEWAKIQALEFETWCSIEDWRSSSTS